jgi:hypothetical protein
MSYFATCPKCSQSFGFDLDDEQTRTTCPYCLRNFDPFKPLPIASECKPSDKAEGFNSLVDSDDEDEPEDFTLDQDADQESKPDQDFEDGI